MEGDQRDGGRFGLGMTIAAWVAAIALLTALFQGWLESEHNPNVGLAVTEPGSASEVVLRRNRGGHYIAPGRINGVPVQFLVDTGATDVAIPESLARRLGLTRGAPMTTRTANGTITTYATLLERVELGPLRGEWIRASILPERWGSDDVLLGMSFLKHLELVQRGDTLTLRVPE